MVDTFLGKNGYTIYKKDFTDKEINKIKKDLKMKPFVPKSSLTKPVPFPVYRESNTKLYVPRFYGIKHFGFPKNIKINKGENHELTFKGELRSIQKPIVEEYIKSAKSGMCGLLELYTGFGKTVVALNIIASLKKKTLIIVHKEFLLRQWVERIEQFLPGAKIGRIQGDTIDYEDKDIVIGMLQSISMKEYSRSTFNTFGLCIIDEVHHMGAEVFSKAFFKIHCTYMLGLSATMKRKDGLSKLFKMFLGEVVCKREREGKDFVSVKCIHYQSDDPEFSKVERNYRGHVHYSMMIKKICEYNRRSEFILDVLKKILTDENNKQIMILAHNKCLLKYLHDAIVHRKISDVGYYIGGMKEKDLKISEGKRVVIATYAMAEEGLDIKTLTTLFMATSKADVVQAVGRILRKKRKQSNIYEIVDQHEVFVKHWKKRLTFYRKQNYEILETDMKGFEKNKWDKVNKTRRSGKYKTQTDPLLCGVCFC